MKKFLIAGNWKMNKLTSEAGAFAEELKAKNFTNAEEVAILVPFTQLAEVGSKLAGSGIGFGAQNVHFEKSGAFTGEISVPMLQEIGVDYCIVGHSERREYFGETDLTVNKKLKALLEAGITPILCVGESLEVREGKGEQTFVANQVFADFEGIPRNMATTEQAEEMCAFIRGVFGGMYDNEAADEILILYGGSMKPSNAADLLAKPDINGGLIGGASLKVDDFSAIVDAAAQLK